MEATSEATLTTDSPASLSACPDSLIAFGACIGGPDSTDRRMRTT
jgi:hypothetical protein